MARILREDAERLPGNVREEYAFRCCDGQILWSMQDLAKSLTHMSDEVLAFQSNAGRTDFSAWVQVIVGDEKLARDVAKSTNQMQAAKNVASRIAFLESKLV